MVCIVLLTLPLSFCHASRFLARLSNTFVLLTGIMEDFFAQLKDFAAHSDGCERSLPSTTHTQDSSIIVTDSETDYDSDRTDFLISRDSPCPRPAQRCLRHHTETLTRRSLIARKDRQNEAITPLVYGNSNLIEILRAGQTHCTREGKSVKNSVFPGGGRNLDRPPPHNWTDHERELLCVLYRWFDDPCSIQITKVFNHICRLDLRPSVLQGQFHYHLRLYGEKCYAAYARCMSIAFGDLESYYADVLQAIQTTAKNLKLQLKRRTIEIKFSSGWAEFAKSPQTRRQFKMLVRKGQSKSMEHMKSVLYDTNATCVSEEVISIPRTNKVVICQDADEAELLVDVENDPDPGPTSSPNGTQSAPEAPCLSFRVWDEGSQHSALFDGGFVARAFKSMTGPLPVPMSQEDPYWKFLVALHLSKTGDTPLFISTATSLLQTLSYSVAKESPCMAVIDLSAPCLQQKDKLFHAAEIFPQLKAQGLARWAHYQGLCDYFCSVNIPKEAVLYTFAVDDLWLLAGTDSACAQLLYKQAFEPGRRTKDIAAVLRDRDCVLSPKIAGAMGRIARVFGMHELSIAHLTEFVAKLVDGFFVQQIQTTDIHVISNIASTFARRLRHEQILHQDVMNAFLDGVDKGARSIARWLRSSSGRRRSWKR